MDPAIVSLFAAGTTFVGTHFALSHPLRAPLVKVLGEKGFLGLYSLVALAAFAWMVLAFRAAPPGGGGIPGPGGNFIWALASLLTVLALVLFLGSFKANPALPDTSPEKVAAAEPKGVFRVTRHPMMWGFALWALSHMMLSWSQRTTVLAGMILVLALVGAHLQDRKKEALQGEAWKHWEARTSYFPKWSQLGEAGPVLWLAALLLWLAITWFHGWWAGVPAGVWKWV